MLHDNIDVYLVLHMLHDNIDVLNAQQLAKIYALRKTQLPCKLSSFLCWGCHTPTPTRYFSPLLATAKKRNKAKDKTMQFLTLIRYERSIRDSTVLFTRFILTEWILGFVFAISFACSVIDCSCCVVLQFLGLIWRSG